MFCFFFFVKTKLRWSQCRRHLNALYQRNGLQSYLFSFLFHKTTAQKQSKSATRATSLFTRRNMQQNCDCARVYARFFVSFHSLVYSVRVCMCSRHTTKVLYQSVAKFRATHWKLILLLIYMQQRVASRENGNVWQQQQQRQWQQQKQQHRQMNGSAKTVLMHQHWFVFKIKRKINAQWHFMDAILNMMQIYF